MAKAVFGVIGKIIYLVLFFASSMVLTMLMTGKLSGDHALIAGVVSVGVLILCVVLTSKVEVCWRRK